MLKIRQSEAEFQQQILDLAHLTGWSVAHFRPAKTDKGWRTPVQADGKGFPDLIMVQPEKQRCIFVEVKSEKGKLSLEQLFWRMTLLTAGVEYYTWRPSQWDEIAEVLQA